MTNEHTPGPWYVQGPHDAPWVQAEDPHTGIMPQTMADARLIAAAPDMLAALEAAKGVVDWAADNGADRAAIRAMQQMVKNAIQKATQS